MISPVIAPNIHPMLAVQGVLTEFKVSRRRPELNALQRRERSSYNFCQSSSFDPAASGKVAIQSVYTVSFPSHRNPPHLWPSAKAQSPRWLGEARQTQ
eukprot:5347934-Amphidinium_carterae.1